MNQPNPPGERLTEPELRKRWHAIEQELEHHSEHAIFDVIYPLLQPDQPAGLAALGRVAAIRDSFWYQLIRAFQQGSYDAARSALTLAPLRRRTLTPVQQVAVSRVHIRNHALDTSTEATRSNWRELHHWWRTALWLRDPLMLFSCYSTLAGHLSWRADRRAWHYLQSCRALDALLPVELGVTQQLHSITAILHMNVPDHRRITADLSTHTLLRTAPEHLAARFNFLQVRTQHNITSQHSAFNELVRSAPGGLGGFLDDAITCHIRDLQHADQHDKAMDLGLEALEALAGQRFSEARIKAALWPTSRIAYLADSAARELMQPARIAAYPHTPPIPALEVVQLQRWLRQGRKRREPPLLRACS